MEFATIVTVKQVCFAALIRSLRLYMEQDYCVCAPTRPAGHHGAASLPTRLHAMQVVHRAEGTRGRRPRGRRLTNGPVVPRTP